MVLSSGEKVQQEGGIKGREELDSQSDVVQAGGGETGVKALR